MAKKRKPASRAGARPVAASGIGIPQRIPSGAASFRRITGGGSLEPLTVTGRQHIRTLRALIGAGAAGVTAHQVGGWAFRLAAYVHTLRHRYRLEIETVREDHDGGWHARYVLRSNIAT